MTHHRSTELGCEVAEKPPVGRRLETLDDIPREIADRRLHAEFGEYIPPEKSEALRAHPDHIERPEDFQEAAKKAGLENTDGVLGWATDLENPAHVLKGDVPTEIATLIHEDLHRLTHPETLREMSSNPALRELYEGITEYLAQHAMEGFPGQEATPCYPEQVESAERLAREIGEAKIRNFFFEHEMAKDLASALDRLQQTDVQSLAK
jgi:hypothetical protein